MKNKSNRKRTKQNHKSFCPEDYTPAMPYVYVERKLLDEEIKVNLMNRDVEEVKVQLASLAAELQALKSSLQRNR